MVALSTTEAEYISLSEAIREGLWLKGLSEELGFGKDSVEIHYDSQSAIALSKNVVFHERLKHVAVRYHFGRDQIKKGVIRVLKISTACNPADIFNQGTCGNRKSHCRVPCKQGKSENPSFPEVPDIC